MPANQSEYDYVVIGAGAAGSIVAGEAAAAGYRVLLLEAGLGVAPDNNEVWDPTRWNEVLKDYAFEIGFESTKQANLDNRVMNLLQSKGLGGCQIHNAMVCPGRPLDLRSLGQRARLHRLVLSGVGAAVPADREHGWHFVAAIKRVR